MDRRLRRADGEYRWHMTRRVPLRDDEGNIVKWYGIAFDIEDQKRAESALRESEARLAEAERELRLTIDRIPTLAWHTRPDGFAEYLNKRWLDYTGLSLDRALGWEWQIAIHPEDLPRLLDSWREILEAGKPAEVEARMRRFDGEYRWFLFRPEPLRDEFGNIVRWYGTNTDIEDRKRAEDALRQSEAYLAEAQRLSHTGSFGWNVSSGEIVWSEESYRIFEYDPATRATIDMVLNRVHPDDVALVRQVIDRATTHKEAFDFEHRLLMPDGSVKHLNVVAHPLIDEPGELQFVGAVMDITARKKSEEALRNSEQRYRHLFQHMPIALWQLNASKLVELFNGLRAEGVTELRPYIDQHPDLLQQLTDAVKIEEVNERMIELLGARDASEILGLTRFRHISPDTFLRGLESRWRGEPTHQQETKIVTLDGRVIDVLMTATRPGLITDPDMSLIGIIDITERVRAQEMLQRVQADFAHAARVSMLGELTASIAHEVNQPLAAIVTNGEVGLRLLNRSEPDLAEVRELTKCVVDDARPRRRRHRACSNDGDAAGARTDIAVGRRGHPRGPAVSPARSPIAWADGHASPQPGGAESARGSHATSAGVRQPDGQRDPGDGADGNDAPDDLLFEPHSPIRTPYAALSKTAAPASSRSISITSLTAFSRPRTPAWDWAWPFRAPSSKRMVDAFEPTMNRPMAALVSASHCRRSCISRRQYRRAAECLHVV